MYILRYLRKDKLGLREKWHLSWTVQTKCIFCRHVFKFHRIWPRAREPGSARDTCCISITRLRYAHVMKTRIQSFKLYNYFVCLFVSGRRWGTFLIRTFYPWNAKLSERLKDLLNIWPSGVSIPKSPVSQVLPKAFHKCKADGGNT
jgi:hypothetical protein